MRLRAFLEFGNGHPDISVGEIAWNAEERRAYVEWDAQIRGLGLPISPFLVKDWAQLQTTSNLNAFYGLPSVFGDSVPDGWGRLLMDRDLGVRDSRVPPPMAYLSMVGRHGMGALRYEPADTSAKRVQDLSLDYFARSADRIEEIDHDVLVGIRAISGGSQGARPKFVALLDPVTGRYRDHRSGWEPGLQHVIVKRAARDDLPSAVAIEAAYAITARAAGVTIASTRVVQAENGEKFFETDRFDRSEEQRFHMQSAAALLDQDFRANTVTYENLFQISERLHGDTRDSEQLLRRLAFNVATLNQDDHAKNHAWLMQSDGTWQLSPAFDITFARSAHGYHSMGLAKDDMEMRPAGILALAGRHGIDAARARTIVREVVDAVETLPAALKDHGVPKKTASVIGTAAGKAIKQLHVAGSSRARSR